MAVDTADTGVLDVDADDDGEPATFLAIVIL